MLVEVVKNFGYIHCYVTFNTSAPLISVAAPFMLTKISKLRLILLVATSTNN